MQHNQFEQPKGVESQIKEAGTLEQLFDAIRSIGVIKGSQKEYQAEEIIQTIKTIQGAEAVILVKTITNTYGIRDKVKELLKIPEQTEE